MSFISLDDGGICLSSQSCWDRIFLKKIFFSSPSRKKKMSFVGTKWKLDKLLRRSELNGRLVTVVENMEKTSGRVLVEFDDGKDNTRILVKPNNLVSRLDDAVDATFLADAFASLRNNASGDDVHMNSFIKRYEQGDFKGALSAAGCWSLKQLHPI